MKPAKQMKQITDKTPEQKEFEATYERMKLFVAKAKGPALAIACRWHLQEVVLLKAQIINLLDELKNESK